MQPCAQYVFFFFLVLGSGIEKIELCSPTHTPEDYLTSITNKVVSVMSNEGC